MINYFKRFSNKFFSSKGADPLKMEATPYRDWKIIIVGFFVGLVISLGLNIYMSYQINSDTFLSPTAKKYEGLVLNRDGLARVLVDLATKDAVHSGRATSSVSVIDPSR
jgi:hypothetical protein